MITGINTNPSGINTTDTVNSSSKEDGLRTQNSIASYSDNLENISSDKRHSPLERTSNVRIAESSADNFNVPGSSKSNDDDDQVITKSNDDHDQKVIRITKSNSTDTNSEPSSLETKPSDHFTGKPIQNLPDKPNENPILSSVTDDSRTVSPSELNWSDVESNLPEDYVSTLDSLNESLTLLSHDEPQFPNDSSADSDSEMESRMDYIVMVRYSFRF